MSRDMASTELERTTRCEGEGMSTGTLLCASEGPLAPLLEASGDTGRGGGATPRVGGPSSPLLWVLATGAASGGGGTAAAGMAAGVDAGRGGGEARARVGGAPPLPSPGSEAGWLATLSGMEEAEEREARLVELPLARRCAAGRGCCSSREGRREPVEVVESTSNDGGRGTSAAAATAGGSGRGLGAGASASAAAAAAAAARAAWPPAEAPSVSTSANRLCCGKPKLPCRSWCGPAALPVLLCACSSALTVSSRSKAWAACASDMEACGLICRGEGRGREGRAGGHQREGPARRRGRAAPVQGSS